MLPQKFLNESTAARSIGSWIITADQKCNPDLISMRKMALKRAIFGGVASRRFAAAGSAHCANLLSIHALSIARRCANWVAFYVETIPCVQP